MTPLDKYVWVGIITGYITVSIIMYLVTRVSPFEWTQDSDGHYNNDFHLQNSLWFNLAALLQQGADFSPKYKNYSENVLKFLTEPKQKKYLLQGQI